MFCCWPQFDASRRRTIRGLDLPGTFKMKELHLVFVVLVTTKSTGSIDLQRE